MTTPGRTAKKFEIEGSVKIDSSTIRSGLSHAGHEVPHRLLHDIMMRFEVGASQTQAPNLSEARAFALVALHHLLRLNSDRARAAIAEVGEVCD